MPDADDRITEAGAMILEAAAGITIAKRDLSRGIAVANALGVLLAEIGMLRDQLGRRAVAAPEPKPAPNRPPRRAEPGTSPEAKGGGP